MTNNIGQNTGTIHVEQNTGTIHVEQKQPYVYRNNLMTNMI